MSTQQTLLADQRLTKEQRKRVVRALKSYRELEARVMLLQERIKMPAFWTPETEIVGGRPQGIPSDPTGSRAAALEKMQNDLARLSPMLEDVQAGLRSLTEEERRVVQMLYIDGSHTAEGAAAEMHRGDATVERISARAIWRMAVTMGIADLLQSPETEAS